MTVTLDELENFIETFEKNGLEEITEQNLRKSIRAFWNVASDATVQSRINTLQDEGWIEKQKKSDVWTINHEKEDGIEKLFRD